MLKKSVHIFSIINMILKGNKRAVFGREMWD